MESITLKDYQSNKKKFELENYDEIKTIIIFILCGDELAFIVYNNDEVIVYDSNDDRQMDILDNLYVLPKSKITTFSRLAGTPEERMVKINGKD